MLSRLEKGGSMDSTEHLSPTDLAEIADAAKSLGLQDIAVILIDALYDQLDGREVEDLSDVVALVRWAVFNKPDARPLRRRQLKVLRMLFSLAVPIAAIVSEPRYVVSAAAATFAILEVSKTAIAQATPVVALRSLMLGGGNMRSNGRHTHAQHYNNQDSNNTPVTNSRSTVSCRYDVATDGNVPYVVMDGFGGP